MVGFTTVMDVVITPSTLLIGLIGNTVSICVLRKTKELQVRFYEYNPKKLTASFSKTLKLNIRTAS